MDWADTHHDVVVLDETGRRVGSRRFAHSHDGLNALKQFLLSIATAPEQLVCILETNHGLLISFLLEAGLPVDPVNPKTANPLRKGAGARTDRIDASVQAKTGRFRLDDLRQLQPESPPVQEWKTLTRDQDALVQMQTRLVNQLTACLKDYSPAALNLCATLQQRSTWVFLQTYPTPQAAQAASREAILAPLRAGKHTNPTQGASSIFEERHRPQLVANEAIVRATSRVMVSLSKHLMVGIEDIAGDEKEIRPLFLTQKDHEIWSSLPRAGQRLAPRLLAEWGDDRTRSADATSVQTLAGSAAVPLESGNDAKAHTRFACLMPLRNHLHQFAWQSTLQEPWALAYYQRKRKEGKTHSMAVRALAHVWVRIISRMWVSQTCSQAETCEAAQLPHAKRAA